MAALMEGFLYNFKTNDDMRRVLFLSSKGLSPPAQRRQISRRGGANPTDQGGSQSHLPSWGEGGHHRSPAESWVRGQAAPAAAMQRQLSVYKCIRRYIFARLSSDTAPGFPRIKPGSAGKGRVFCNSFFSGQIPSIDRHKRPCTLLGLPLVSRKQEELWRQ